MRVDRAVAQAKFARELEILDAQASTLDGRGIWVRSRAFPNLDVVFVARQPLLIFDSNGTFPVPILGARSFGARFDLEDFDLTAPSVTFRDVRDWSLMPPRGGLAGFLEIEGEQKQVLLLHPVHNRLFLCVQGVREYHEHPEHTNDDWLAHREEGALLRAVESVWKTCVDNVVPIGRASGQGLQFELAPARR
jgi:hypothetical protein